MLLRSVPESAKVLKLAKARVIVLASESVLVKVSASELAKALDLRSL